MDLSSSALLPARLSPGAPVSFHQLLFRSEGAGGRTAAHRSQGSLTLEDALVLQLSRCRPRVEKLLKLGLFFRVFRLDIRAPVYLARRTAGRTRRGPWSGDDVRSHGMSLSVGLTGESAGLLTEIARH